MRLALSSFVGFIAGWAILLDYLLLPALLSVFAAAAMVSSTNSTLNEEARGGGRAVAKATIVVLVAVTFLFVLQVYLGAIYDP